MRRNAIGIVVKDRWDLTIQTLNSLYYSDQNKRTYDLFIINNNSSTETSEKLKNVIKNGMIEVKNAIFTPELSISQAWNLFLALTTEYENRIKFDNDLILHNTIKPPIERKPNQPTPADVDPKAGGPQSVSIVKGSGLKRKGNSIVDISSSFIDKMDEFAKEYDVGLVSLVPVPKGQLFGIIYRTLINAKRNGQSYLNGGCMLITKKTFDDLGYFDERTPRGIDIEYSQRALRNKINIGYHPTYGVVHIGHGNQTEPKNIYAKNIELANKSEIYDEKIASFCPSMWQSHQKRILSACEKDKIVSFV